MEPHEQFRERVEQPVLEVRDTSAGEENPVREREVEMAGDEHGVQLLPVGACPPAYDTDDLHDRKRGAAQVPEEPVLPLGRPLRQLLERVEPAVVLHETNDVARDAALHLDDPG